MWEENATLDDQDELDLAGRYQPEPDPISTAVGSPGFASRHILDECRERFEDSRVSRFPETFDRFYWQPQRLLIDILADGTPEQTERDRARKRVEFKTAWCAEHGWRYVVMTETDSLDAGRVRELLHSPATQTAAEPQAAKRAPARRGQVQRPKATAQ